MRTVRSSGRLMYCIGGGGVKIKMQKKCKKNLGGVWPGGCLLLGVSDLGGVCSWGVSTLGGVYSGGCLPQGVFDLGGVYSGGCLLSGVWYPSMHWGRNPPVDRHTPVKT